MADNEHVGSECTNLECAILDLEDLLIEDSESNLAGLQIAVNKERREIAKQKYGRTTGFGKTTDGHRMANEPIWAFPGADILRSVVPAAKEYLKFAGLIGQDRVSWVVSEALKRASMLAQNTVDGGPVIIEAAAMLATLEDVPKPDPVPKSGDFTISPAPVVWRMDD